MVRGNVVYDKAFSFAIKMVQLNKMLCEDKKEYVLSKQLLKAGTSIGANIRESLEAQSRKDFISKLSIALKEAVESEYWLDLLTETQYIDKDCYLEASNQLREIIKLLNAIIKTTNANSDN